VGFPALRGLVRDATFGVIGVPATVTIPGGDPVETRIIWLTPSQDGAPGAPAVFQRNDPQRAMAIRRDDLPTLPLESLVAVTEPNLEDPTEWLVDSFLVTEPEHYRVSVRPRPIEES
jgi:hypothetical protein